MYAIVDFKGLQFRVVKGRKLKVPYLAHLEEGNEVEMSEVLVISDDDKGLRLGQPIIANAKVVAEVIQHSRDKKVIVFKKKRRKGYRKKQGHRQYFTELQIKDIQG